MSNRPSLTIMGDHRGRWLWSHNMNSVLLPDSTVKQAETWLKKYLYFCDHTDNKFLQWQFNAEGMNLAKQVQLFLGPDIDVSYTDRHPDEKVKKGANRQITIDFWYGLYSDEPCFEVDVYRPLNVLDAIMEICEESGDIAEIEADYYQQFLNMDDEEMRGLIRLLIFSMAPTINRTNRWKSDDALLDMLESTLHIIMCGVMFFPECGGEPVFNKPTIMPTEEEKQLLREHAKAERETIREVLCDILHEQAEKEVIT